MFKPPVCRYSTRSQIPLDKPVRKIIAGKKNLSFVGPKIWSKMTLVPKIIEHCLLL